MTRQAQAARWMGSRYREYICTVLAHYQHEYVGILIDMESMDVVVLV